MGAYTQPIAIPSRRVAETAQRAPSRPADAEAAEEGRLLAAASRGERAALERIIAAHRNHVFAYLCARLLEPADAEDLCQEVFLRCLQGRVRLDAPVRLRPWLLGIARNVLYEHVRRVQRRKEVAWTQLCLDLEELAPADDAAQAQAVAHLGECLEALGPSAREALRLRYEARLRLAEIGECLRRSEGAVKLLMFRARQALRNCLDRKLGRRDDG